ncbi:hypothetical protein Trydic_g23759 [Trypoxylus dichotomus]
MNIYRGRTHTEVYLSSLLYDSVEDQDISSVRKLLVEKKANPNIILPGKGISCFHLAVGNDSPKFAMEVTSLMIQGGGDPNVLSDEGLTPVHIAAAWGRTDILRLLLHCGGDPQLTDNCYKSALHYALNEGWEEAAVIIKDFIGCQRLSIYDNFSPKENACTVKLDKVLLNNGFMIGEYEIDETVKDEMENEQTRNEMLQMDLNTLPQTDSQEYVLNWCNTQELISNQTEDDSAELESANNLGRAIPKKGSSSSKSSSAKSNYQSETFSGCSDKVKFNDVTFRQRRKHPDSYISKDICKHKESSRESGILTLQESSDEDGGYSEDDLKYLVDKVQTAKLIRNQSIKENKDNSSDYCTCTEGSETANILEKTIYEFSTRKNPNHLKSNNNDNQDLSFVSVSEVYKHTDPDEGVVLYEKRILSSSICSVPNDSISTVNSQTSLPRSLEYDTDTLRKELTAQGFDPGPITKTTKRVYLRKLYQLKKNPPVLQCHSNNNEKVYSPELQRTLKEENWCQNLFQHQHLEETVKQQFANPDPSRRWRGGTAKSSFTYLLLDPRITQNLPHRYDQLQKSEVWSAFLSAIFYVGKGKRSRPFQHLYEAAKSYNKSDFNANNEKIRKILDIWKDNHGVVCLHIFQNVIPVEAYTREASMISALNLENITNIKGGEFYGVSATWSQKQKNLLGIHLLYKAMKIFLHEGERQIFLADIE